MAKIWKTHLVIGLFLCVILATYSLSSGAQVQVVPPEATQMTALRKSFDAKVDAYSGRMIEMNDYLYHNPESGFLEFKTSKMLTDELEKHGFVVEKGIPGLEPNYDKLKLIGGLMKDYKGPSGLPTAFRAKYKGKSDHPVIAFMPDFDALRGDPPFHGCQHNQQGPAALGAAIALGKVMEENNLPGSVWVIGIPAEEVGPPPKVAAAKAGYVKGIDFMIRSHGTVDKTEREGGGFACCCGSIRQMKYTFYGKSAHASRPWQGASALDAVFQLFNGMNMLRQVSEPQFRFMGVVTDGGVAPNIIPEMASATIWIRHFADETKVGKVSPNKAQGMIDAKVEQLNNIAKGAALATGSRVEIDQYGRYVPGISVGAMNDLAFQYGVEYGGANIQEKPIPPDNGGWDETGSVSILFPGTRVAVGVAGMPQVAGHSIENANVSISPVGHKGLILTGKVMGAIGLRLVMDPEVRKKAEEEHAGWLKRYNE
ncbi:MAG: peptidase dimerization domain-containing protein [Deltaproteobacteria bacterium]